MVKIVKTPTQPELNKSWVWHVTDLIWTKLQRKLYGSIFNRYLPSPWLLSREHFFWGQLSISVITQLLLNQFWPKFKCRFLGLSLLDAIRQDDICPCNICSGEICPYHQYLTKFFWTKILLDPNFYDTKLFGTKIILVSKFFLDPIFYFNTIFYYPKLYGVVVGHLATVSNLNEVAFELLWVELSYVGFWQYQLAWPQLASPAPTYQSSMTSIASLGQGYYCICVGVCVSVCMDKDSVPSLNQPFTGL